MQKLIINGGKKLKGEISIQGAKNAVLPIMAGAVLCGEEITVHNCPRISDTYSAMRILTYLGGKARFEAGHTVTLKCETVTAEGISDELMREMRSSIFFLGAVLGRAGRCRITFPGGCDLGPRPIDMHLAALRKMGVTIREEYGVLDCSAERGLRGAKISLSFPSVGTTENILLAAVLADGVTVIQNAAREPEIADLADFLNACGAKISGAGSGKITVSGVKKLHGCEYTVMPDRIACATYLACAAAAGGGITALNCRPADMESILPIFEQMGCIVHAFGDKIYFAANRPLRAIAPIRTMVYPGFPTDAQAFVMAALCRAKGTSVFVENIFENRYKHVDGLRRMGADVLVEGKVAVIEGVNRLYGAKVEAPDLRGGAGLVTAALSAEGRSEISNIHYIDRGYEEIENVLAAVGADISRV
ncbi:MAG: UDP-N-acetylglucosamine 1-carboxyvinyltransferase [Ruminococcus sp.]|nr:UDP-N-acetylglucosamine 1-carboxyvinyltransferase [Ruminococcus sp.]MCM1380677.1 UDP-N-acetylglucosamine 1-carboxyvinyltransferase [Muribaculaceae bacterium]MCM1478473.1 UDP-N-acetylglucosamine 1-carboxyvinyltransferase [Muribaculaceae bacterium]